jgi:hypothetical protein
MEDSSATFDIWDRVVRGVVHTDARHVDIKASHVSLPVQKISTQLATTEAAYEVMKLYLTPLRVFATVTSSPRLPTLARRGIAKPMNTIVRMASRLLL